VQVLARKPRCRRLSNKVPWRGRLPPRLAGAIDLGVAESTVASGWQALPRSNPALSGWTGDDSKVAEFSVQRVTDAVMWQALGRAPDMPPPPPIDFAKPMVVAVVTGTVSATYIPSGNLLNATEQDGIYITIGFFLNDLLTDTRANHYLILVFGPFGQTVRGDLRLVNQNPHSTRSPIASPSLPASFIIQIAA
jgi:hypothetical protein